MKFLLFWLIIFLRCWSAIEITTPSFKNDNKQLQSVYSCNQQLAIIEKDGQIKASSAVYSPGDLELSTNFQFPMASYRDTEEGWNKVSPSFWHITSQGSIWAAKIQTPTREIQTTL